MIGRIHKAPKTLNQGLFGFVCFVVLFAFPVFSHGQVPADLIHIPRESAVVVPMAEWEVPNPNAGPETAPRIGSAAGQAAVDRAPDYATRYESRDYVFPMGMMRVLTFDKYAGPLVHQITFETQLFLLQGSGSVGVGDQEEQIVAGDAVFLPSGVLRNPNPTEDTVVALFVVNNTAENPRSMVVRGADLSSTLIAQYMRDGEARTAVKEEDLEAAPADAGRFLLTRYAFDGNSIRKANLFKGGKTTPATNSNSDILIYLTKGRMRRIEDGVTYEVAAGDAIREEFGKTGYWELLEESEFLATNMPFDPSKPRINHPYAVPVEGN